MTRRETGTALEFYGVLSGKIAAADCRYLGKAPQRKRQTEAGQQAALFQWATLVSKQHPELLLMFHIPNGEYRNEITGARLKAQGVKAGVPDILLPVARQGYNGMFIELKAPLGRLQDNQKQWLEHLAAQGYKAMVCYGFDEAKTEIEQYLGIK